MTRQFTTSAKCLTYYVDSPLIRELEQAFGSHLEGLPVCEKSYILGLVGLHIGAFNDPDLPNDFDIKDVCRQFNVRLGYFGNEFLDLTNLLNQLDGDQLLALAEFIAIDLRTTQEVER